VRPVLRQPQNRYSSDDGDCEHVKVHNCMREKFFALHGTFPKFFMLPKMMLIYDLDEAELNGYNVKVSP
jgi:hypothetical protein